MPRIALVQQKAGPDRAKNLERALEAMRSGWSGEPKRSMREAQGGQSSSSTRGSATARSISWFGFGFRSRTGNETSGRRAARRSFGKKARFDENGVTIRFPVRSLSFPAHLLQSAG